VPDVSLARFISCALLALAFTGAGVFLTSTSAGERPAERALTARMEPAPAGTSDSAAGGDSLELALVAAAPDLDPYVLELALESQRTALGEGLVHDPTTLTVIDYSRPSTERRLFVFDLEERRLVFEELVAHGRNSGEQMATRFSNANSSNMTSLGLFVTQETYVGEHGTSLRLEGLEPGFNDRARERAIVVHGASYVSAAVAAQTGRLGRSLGCPALPVASAPKVIDRIRGGSAVFAYYPDARWLARSRFIGGGDSDAGPPISALEPRLEI
jgi:hypothetical protein